MDKYALDCQSRSNHYICVCRVFILIALRTYRLSENVVGAWNSMNRINRTIEKIKQVELSNLYINNPLPIENPQILQWLGKAILWAKSNSCWKEIINYPGSTWCTYWRVKPSTAKKDRETSCDNTLSSAADNCCLWIYQLPTSTSWTPICTSMILDSPVCQCTKCIVKPFRPSHCKL